MKPSTIRCTRRCPIGKYYLTFVPAFIRLSNVGDVDGAATSLPRIRLRQQTHSVDKILVEFRNSIYPRKYKRALQGWESEFGSR